MNKKTIVISILTVILIGSAFVLFKGSQNHSQHTSDTATAQTEEQEYYTCPMHPSVISDKPGACPVCGMALVKKTKPKEMAKDEMSTLHSVSLSHTQRVTANVATAVVERRTLEKQVDAVGVVDVAEPQQAKVTARFRGRIEKLYVNFTGETVRKGQPLFDLYSPDLISAQQEYLLALDALKNAREAEYDTTTQSQLLQASKERLRIHFGMTESQIDELGQSRQSRSTITYFSPIAGTVITKDVQEGQYVDEGMVLYELANLSTVWIYLDVYEVDLPLVKIGQTVKVTTEAEPYEAYTGKIIFIDPVVNSETRTVRIRTEFINRDNKLKPDMYVKAKILIPAQKGIVVPTSAILFTGKRNIVWVETSENTFEPREVKIGIITDSYTQILQGLDEGESVVISGGYLLESESQLRQPTTSMSGHQHEQMK